MLLRAAGCNSIEKINETFHLKNKQFARIESVLKGSDTLEILSTAYGKSLIYQLLPDICNQLPGQPDNGIVIVLSPLKALIADQVSSANQLKVIGLTACDIDIASHEDMANGKYNILLGTPEAWLENSNSKTLLKSKLFRNNLICMVIDEVHKVAWGVPSSQTGKAFRDAFGRIGELRAFCREGIPVLALSATVDVDYTDLIKASCGLSKSVKIIHTCSDRPNIRLAVVPIKTKDLDCLQWLVDNIIENRENCMKALIYCRTQSLVGWLYDELMYRLGKYAYSDDAMENSNRLIGMYHADTISKNKERVLDALTKDVGKIRIVIATSALGCGINALDLQYVIHFGPAHGLIDYCQQIGRAGRSGQPLCHAILYYYPQFSKSVNQSMKDYMKTQGCLRTELFSPFNESGNPVPSKTPGHLCCSNCAKKCKCIENCKSYLFEYVEVKTNPELPIPIREVTIEHKNIFRQKLIEYHAIISSKSASVMVPSSIFSELTHKIIEDIIACLPYIDGAGFLLENTSLVDRKVAVDVAKLVYEMFGDFEFKETNMTQCAMSEEEKYAFSDFSFNDSDDEEAL